MNAEELFDTLPGHHETNDGTLGDSHPMNRKYIGWCPGDDYMNGKGWSENLEFQDWSKFRDEFDLPNDLNILADFYFSITFSSKTCPHCDGSGLNPETKRISDDFYDFDGRGTRWRDKITEDEVDALWNEKRLGNHRKDVEVKKPTAEEVNEVNRGCGMGIGGYHHDGLNGWILLKTRASRDGVWGYCKHCEDGNLRLGPDRVQMLLWVLHPRKGTGRGITIENILEQDIPEIKDFLRRAHQQNQDRFSWAFA